jgi:hypothetical protein
MRERKTGEKHKMMDPESRNIIKDLTLNGFLSIISWACRFMHVGRSND